MNLPVIHDCNGCGACCMTASLPPGYVLGAKAIILHPITRAMPAEVQRELKAAVDDVQSGRRAPLSPCLWLDLETRRCRHYDLRPPDCRRMELGGEHCRIWRDMLFNPEGTAGSAVKREAIHKLLGEQ